MGNETALAYAAGVIDGEGCIYITKKRKGRSFELRVSVDNSSEWLCVWFKIHFGGSVFSYTNTHKHPQWKWLIGTRNATKFLASVYPYLQIKQSQASLAIKFQANKSPNPRRKGYTDEQLAVQEARFILLKSMHHPFAVSKQKED